MQLLAHLLVVCVAMYCACNADLVLALLLPTAQLDAAHVCYLLAGVTPAAIDAGPVARMLLLGIDHRSVKGQRAMRHLLPLMRAEVYEWARCLDGGW